jgi:hypothetical protein
MISWHKDSFLTASTAIQGIAKLIDFTKNVHAESFNKELGRTTLNTCRALAWTQCLSSIALA